MTNDRPVAGGHNTTHETHETIEDTCLIVKDQEVMAMALSTGMWMSYWMIIWRSWDLLIRLVMIKGLRDRYRLLMLVLEEVIQDWGDRMHDKL
jgi:hypothetical protein